MSSSDIPVVCVDCRNATRLRALLRTGGKFSVRYDTYCAMVGYIATGRFYLRIPIRVGPRAAADQVLGAQAQLADIFDRWGDDT